MSMGKPAESEVQSWIRGTKMLLPLWLHYPAAWF